jgi:hypothetical protein
MLFNQYLVDMNHGSHSDIYFIWDRILHIYQILKNTIKEQKKDVLNIMSNRRYNYLRNN